MKSVVVHASSKPVELDWANQFAGLDAQVKAQFSAVDFASRSTVVSKITGFTWTDVVAAVTAAAKAAGTGGVVIVVSGHGGAVPGNPDGGVLNWDPTDADVDLNWDRQKIRKGLFWDDMVARYLDPIPLGNPPNQKGIDEKNIKEKRGDFQITQKRHEAFEALDQIGQALRANGVKRLTFTSCTAGRAPNFLKRLAKICGTEIACFNQKTRVFNDVNAGAGKSRLILDVDTAREGLAGSSNILSARVFSPDLDNSSIAFVAKP